MVYMLINDDIRIKLNVVFVVCRSFILCIFYYLALTHLFIHSFNLSFIQIIIRKSKNKIQID